MTPAVAPGAAPIRRCRLIAFAGAIGAGKSAAARVLCDPLPNGVVVPFAGTLKAMMVAFGLSEKQVSGDEKSTPCDLLCGRTPREAMQTLGTEWGRHFIGADIWLRAWAARAEPELDAGKFVFVDDLRFANEAALIRRLGGMTIRLERAGDVDASAARHASERQGFRVDAVVENTGTIADLDRALARAITAWRFDL